MDNWKARALAQRNAHVEAGMQAAGDDAVARVAAAARLARLQGWVAAGRYGNGFMGRSTYGTDNRTAGYLRQGARRLHVVR